MLGADRVNGWKNHFARTQRWQERALSALDDLPNIDFHEVLDFALAYFVWSHSLREWLIEDEATTKEELNKELAQHPEWKIVRDIANRSRHLKITHNPHDPEWSVSREYAPFSIHFEGRERHHVNLFFDGQKYRLSDIIRRASAMWQAVLQAKGLA